MKIKRNTQSGFTLIEMVIYVALFAFIMAGALVSVYGILGTSARNQVKAMVQEEGSFLQGKIDWVLSSADSASVSEDGYLMTVVRFDGTQMSIIVSAETGNMSIDRGEGQKDLNNSNVTVSCAPALPKVGCFTYTESSGDGINPKNVEAHFTVNSRTTEGLPYSQDFSTIKYLRK